MIDSIQILQFEALFLILTSFFTSFMTASIGIGGGTVLLAIMTQMLPIHSIIPIHGAVQLGSNFGRALMFFKNIDLSLFIQFLLGSLIGAVSASFYIEFINPAWAEIILGSFILISVAKLYRPTYSQRRGIMSWGGLFTTMFTFVVGATGPFVLGLLKPFKLLPTAIVGTVAGCLVVQHGLKIFVFGFNGFDFEPYIQLVTFMVLTGAVGTFLGKKVLLKVDPERFQKGVDFILVILGLKLMITGFLLAT